MNSIPTATPTQSLVLQGGGGSGITALSHYQGVLLIGIGRVFKRSLYDMHDLHRKAMSLKPEPIGREPGV